jgi:hypothetical protein
VEAATLVLLHVRQADVVVADTAAGVVGMGIVVELVVVVVGRDNVAGYY